MARSHFRGTIYGDQTAGVKPLAGAAVRLFDPATGYPWPHPVYPHPSNGTPYALPVLTDSLGTLDLWADEPARLAITITHPSYQGGTGVIDIETDPSEQATDSGVADSVASHEAKVNPHPQYLTDEAADLVYEQLLNKGATNGYAPLGPDGLLPGQFLPPLAISEVFVCLSEAEMLALNAQTGDVCVRLDTSENYILAASPASDVANWTKLAPSMMSGNVTVLRRQEFSPSAGATTVVLALMPTGVLSLTRNGVEQSALAGHYGVSGVTVTFPTAFVAGERVSVMYEIGSSAVLDGYSKLESDARYEPIDTAYTKQESDNRFAPLAGAGVDAELRAYVQRIMAILDPGGAPPPAP